MEYNENVNFPQHNLHFIKISILKISIIKHKQSIKTTISAWITYIMLRAMYTNKNRLENIKINNKTEFILATT